MCVDTNAISKYLKSSVKSPRGAYFFEAVLMGWGGGGGGGGGGLIERGGAYLAKRITGSKNTVVRDRVDLSVVQVTVNSI